MYSFFCYKRNLCAFFSKKSVPKRAFEILAVIILCKIHFLYTKKYGYPIFVFKMLDMPIQFC